MSQKQTDTDEPILKELRDRFAYCVNRWEKIRKEGDTDMRYVSGNPWSDKDRRAREDAGRPCISFDEIGQYLNQVVNEVRANPRAVKFSPTGDGANDDTAQFYGDKMREIEYRSRAQIAYTTAFENCLQRSYGYVRLSTAFPHEKSFDQEIVVESVPNPNAVYPDPDAMRPDGSDWQYLFYIESYSAEEFQSAFPNAQIKDFTPDMLTLAPNWLGQNRVQVAEYWKVLKTSKDLVLWQMPDGSVQAQFEDEPKPKGRGVKEVKRRTVEIPQVCQYLTNGVELLPHPNGEKKREWAGKYIPFAACYGKVLWLDQGSGPERMILSMTRLGRDPQMAYAFYRTSEIENVGMTTKVPYRAYEGTLDAKQMQDIKKSMHEPLAVLLSKPFLKEHPNQLMPLPERNVSEPFIQALSMGAEECRRAIMSAMAMSPLPTSAQRQNEKSGVALRQIEESGQKGSYHFMDAYNNMLTHIGVMVEDLMDKVYDTSREVGVVKVDEKAETVYLNGAQPPNDKARVLKSTKGRHTTTVGVGPAFENERQQASDFADTFVTSPLMQLLGPEKGLKVLALVVKLKNLGVIGDQIAEIIDPQSKKDTSGFPPEAQQIIAELQQITEGAIAENEQMKQALETKQVEQQAKAAIATETNMTRLKVAEIQTGQKREDTSVQAETDVLLKTMDTQLKEQELRLKEQELALKRMEMLMRQSLERDKLAQAGEQMEQQTEQAAFNAAREDRNAEQEREGAEE